MLYIPFNDPEAAYKTVKDFGDKKGVVGFMVTSPRYKPVHDNAYVKTYALLEEMGKPIAFHAPTIGTTNRSRSPTASSRCMRSAPCGSTWST